MKFHKLDVNPSKIEESLTVKPRILVESGKAFQESTQKEGRYILPRIEAIHAGATRNNTRYPAEKLRGSEELKSGVYSWLHPYAKPVIFNHDVETEATGRIQTAAFSEFTAAGRPGIIVVPKITQEKAIQDILDGRLLTVSIGATTDAAICSVCGTDIISEGYCGHMRGEVYDGVKTEWIVGNIWFDELSWVNVPADSDAMIVGGKEAISMAESFAYDGQTVINLGKNTTEWLVDPKTLLAEGLNHHEEPKRGETEMTEEQIKALQLELEEAKNENTSLVEEKEVLTAENEQLKKDVVEANSAKEAAETTLADKEVELSQTQEALTAKEEEVVELTTTKETLEAEKTALETSLSEEKEARNQVVEENARLAADMHKSTAERVVDLRFSLGKESNREEAIKLYTGRTSESLSDSLADLLKEAEEAPKQSVVRQVEGVQNPASAQDPQAQTESTSTATPEEVLKSLFRGPGARK